MRKKRQFIIGFLLGAMIFSSVSASAASKQTIDAYFGQANLVVNGNPVNKETLLYNGTTYVPLRAAAEMLGKEVAWDGDTNTAYIDEPGTGRTFGGTSAQTQTPTPAPSQSSNKPAFRNSGEIEKYIKDTYKGFSYTTTRTDGLDTISTNRTEKIYGVAASWDTPDKISYIFINSDCGFASKSGYEAAKIYMKKIADDLIAKLPGVEISDVHFYHGWYKYPNIQEGYNSFAYCRWKTVNGIFTWYPTSDDKYAEQYYK